MLTKDFYFDLPPELVAQHPSAVRGEDRLMVLDRASFRASGVDGDAIVSHRAMADLPSLIEPGTLMVFNNSRVRRSRCYGKTTDTGREAEFLFLSELDGAVFAGGAGLVSGASGDCSGRGAGTALGAGGADGAEIALGAGGADGAEIALGAGGASGAGFALGAGLAGGEPLKGRLWKAMVKNAKKQKPGKTYVFADGSTGTIVENPADAGTEFRTVLFEKPLTEAWFDVNGHIPLPPYIKRGDTEEDSERYQNVYARETGSAACPTAGLHFTQGMLAALEAKGVETAFVTLHVGLGTFLPVRAERIEDHKMHEEFFTISEETAEKVNRAKREGRPVLAVGTTSVRTLESAWVAGAIGTQAGTAPGATGAPSAGATGTAGTALDGGAACGHGYLKSGSSSTSIFLYPGYRFKCVDRLFTNFHTPESTLMMLVSAFAGQKNIMDAYRAAVVQRYRFFSYGDAMLII